MSILYNEEQLAIAKGAERVLADRFDKQSLLTLLESQGDFHDGFWKICREQGWTGITIPEEFGGLGLSLIEIGLIAEACGQVTVGAPFLSTSFAVSDGIAHFGSDALKSRWLPGLASGETIGCFAFSENGETLPNVSALAFQNGALTGRKPAVSGAAHADVALVLATATDGHPVLAIAPFANNRVTVDQIEAFDNSRCYADVLFDAASAEVLVQGPQARDAVRMILARLAVVIAYEQTGGAEALLNAARNYALERRAFGQVIGAFQSVKHRIAEMYALVELSRANAIHAASLDGQTEFLRSAAAARLMATEAYDTAARDTIQIHGGIGVTWEAGLHLHQRRARTLALEAGGMAFWEDLLVDELVKGATA